MTSPHGSNESPDRAMRPNYTINGSSAEGLHSQIQEIGEAIGVLRKAMSHAHPHSRDYMQGDETGGARLLAAQAEWMRRADLLEDIAKAYEADDMHLLVDFPWHSSRQGNAPDAAAKLESMCQRMDADAVAKRGWECPAQGADGIECVAGTSGRCAYCGSPVEPCTVCGEGLTRVTYHEGRPEGCCRVCDENYVWEGGDS